MSRRLVIPALMCVAVAAYFSVPWQSHPSAVAPRFIELGHQRSGHQAIVEFPVENRGRAPLQLFGLETSCGCLELSHQDKKLTRSDTLIIGPGEKVQLRGVIVLRGAPGDTLTDVVTLRTNDLEHPVVRINIRAQLESPPVFVVPRELYVRDLVAGTQRSVVFQLRPGKRRSLGSPTVKVGEPNPVIDTIRIVTEREDTDRMSESECRVVIGLKGEGAPGRHNASLEVCVEHEEPIKVPLVVDVVERVRVSPSIVYLPRQSEQGAIFEIVCLCRGPSASSTLQVEPSLVPAGFDIQSTLRNGQMFITVSCCANPAPQAGRHVALLKVTHELGADDVELPIVVDPEMK